MRFLIKFFFFNDTATTEIYTLSLHDALPIHSKRCQGARLPGYENALYLLDRLGTIETMHGGLLANLVLGFTAAPHPRAHSHRLCRDPYLPVSVDYSRPPRGPRAVGVMRTWPDLCRCGVGQTGTAAHDFGHLSPLHSNRADRDVPIRTAQSVGTSGPPALPRCKPVRTPRAQPGSGAGGGPLVAVQSGGFDRHR